MNPNDEKVSDLRCVNCGWGIERLYVQYSPGNIRLMKCENCKDVADPYIECEFMILLIDLILHKTKAFRHLLYNKLTLEANGTKGIFWKSCLINFLLDAHRVSILKGSKTEWDSSRGLLFIIRSCGKVLVDVMLGNLMFASVLLFATRVLLNSALATTRYKDILLAILVSSYFKLFLVAIMVWEFPSSVFVIVDVFVLSSNCVALKVLTRSRITPCVAVCFSAHVAKAFTIHWLPTLLSVSF